MTSLSRRGLLEACLDYQTKPLEITTNGQVGLMRARLEQGGPMEVGEALSLVAQASDQEARFLSDLHSRINDAEELGRHASQSRQQILESVGAHPKVGDLMDAVDVDEVTMALIDRMGGPDSRSRELPEVDRRDVLRAALTNKGL